MWTVAKVKKGQRGLEVFNRECSKLNLSANHFGTILNSNDLLFSQYVAVHTIPDSFSCRHQKLSGIARCATNAECKLADWQVNIVL